MLLRCVGGLTARSFAQFELHAVASASLTSEFRKVASVIPTSYTNARPVGRSFVNRVCSTCASTAWT